MINGHGLLKWLVIEIYTRMNGRQANLGMATLCTLPPVNVYLARPTCKHTLPACLNTAKKVAQVDSLCVCKMVVVIHGEHVHTKFRAQTWCGIDP